MATRNEVDPHAPENDLDKWLAKGKKLTDEELKENGIADIPILDPHHHFFPTNTILPQSYYQTFGRRLPTTKAYEDEALNGDIGRLNVKGTVFIECGSYYDKDAPEHLKYVGESRKIEELAKKCPVVGNQVRVPDLGMEPELLNELLDAHAQVSPHFTGVRVPVTYIEPKRRSTYSSAMDHPNPHDHLRSPEFIRGAKILAERGLVLDIYLWYHQLEFAAELARAVPDLAIIIDHVGGLIGDQEYATPEVQKEQKEVWTQGINALAECPNVRIKLGGILMAYCGFGFDERDAPPTVDELADAQYPWMSYCIEKFGPERCIFESNFPMDKVSCDYESLFASYMVIAKRANVPADDIKKMFYDNAVNTYKLQVEGNKL